MTSVASRLEELTAWGVNLPLIHLNLSWSPAHRLEVMEGIIQVGLQARHHLLDTQRHAPLLQLYFASPLPLFRALHPLRIIVIGRLAAILQGTPGVSYTLDLCYAQDDETVCGLIQALATFVPEPPPAPSDLQRDIPTVLDTSLVSVRLFPTTPKLGAYAATLPATTVLDVAGIPLRVLTLAALTTSLAADADADMAFFLPQVEATELLQRTA